MTRRPTALRPLRPAIALLGLALPALVLGAALAPETAHAGRGGRLADPDAPGPFAVGRSSFELVDAERGDRRLPVDVWYPVDPEDAAGEASEYEILGLSLPSPTAVADAPLSDAGRFGLVVFSHGSGGVRFQSFFLTERLASHGFVVVAPDHVGNTIEDQLGGNADPFAVAAVNRVEDVRALITLMLERSREPGDRFHRRLDPRRIGVTGHSFGGFTSLAMAAGFDGDLPGDDDDLPPDFEPLPPDRRVRAIAPLAPASSPFGDEELRDIRVPTLIVGGTLDTTTPIEPESTRPFELIPRRAVRVDIRGATHFSFSNSCDLVGVLLDQGLPPAVVEALLGDDFTAPCGPEVLDVAAVHRLTNLYAVAHFRRALNREPAYGLLLSETHAALFEPDAELFASRRLPPFLRFLLWILALLS